MKTLIYLILFCQVSIAQTFCEMKTIESVDKINFTELVFIHQDNQIDSVTYNSILTCTQTKAKIYCNIDKLGKKNGQVLIYDSEGKFYVSGEFSSNKKNGWWNYGGCCRILYKNGKQKRKICPLF